MQEGGLSRVVTGVAGNLYEVEHDAQQHPGSIKHERKDMVRPGLCAVNYCTLTDLNEYLPSCTYRRLLKDVRRYNRCREPDLEVRVLERHLVQVSLVTNPDPKVSYQPSIFARGDYIVGKGKKMWISGGDIGWVRFLHFFTLQLPPGRHPTFVHFEGQPQRHPGPQNADNMTSGRLSLDW
jgi:hypothetical protein